MRTVRHSDGLISNRRGAMMMLVVICLPVVLMFSAFAINVAYMQLTRTELRTATDASVRAGSRVLSLSQDVDAARAAAIAAGARNSVAGTPLTIDPNNVTFGISTLDNTSGKYAFTSTADSSTKITGISVKADRTATSADGAVPMLFQGIFDTGTFQPVKTAIATHMDRDVFLVLDRSGSMTTVTPGSNRWKDLKKAVQAFLNELKKTPQQEQVGIATYSTSSTLDEGLKTNYGQLMKTVNSKSATGMTAIGLGMQSGMQGLKDTTTARKVAAKTLVVMTDGIHNTGVWPDAVATTAAADDIIVHTITFGAGADQVLMKKVAANGQGKHWHADDQASLINVFREVARNLPTLITK